jgi:integrase
MSRRSGQSGHLVRRGKWWKVRFRLDVEGVEARKLVSVKVAPVSMRLSRPELERRAMEIVQKEGANSADRFARVVLHEGVTFREQARIYLQEATSRNRGPIKNPTSIEGALRKWINPCIGELPLSLVNNSTVKPLVQQMVKAGKSPRTCEKYVLYCKQIVASLTNDEGDPIYPRTWSAEKLDLPIVVYRKQRRPAFDAEGVAKLVEASKPGQMRMLFVLLAATGMRISEALALETKHFIHGGKAVLVEQQVDKDHPVIVPYVKTEASYREIDLHPSVADCLRPYVARKAGLVFHTGRNTPHLYGNLEKRWLDPILIALGLDEKGMGWHSFRRYRNSWLRAQRCLADLILLWMGHQPTTMTESYSALKKNLPLRWEEAQRCGVGFAVPAEAVPAVPKHRLMVVSRNSGPSGILSVG